MDGLTALPLLLKAKLGLTVIMRLDADAAQCRYR